ncbi:MAG: DUF418 domain-containing protein [Phycisphaerae bacterium]|nr:DUF418 domain-containing protein [Phycisphaerae bacterium]NNF44851.1 DUF418 domain-containing protein [Phycisphaerales bacterium]
MFVDTPPTDRVITPSPPPLAPVGEQERIVSLDVLRGFALLGILLLNIQAFAMIGTAYMHPYAYGSMEGVNGWIWRIVHVFGDQKFWTIFSMLFGAGIVVMTSRAEAAGRNAAGLHYRRMGWLILFGLLHAHLLWYGDILYFYGMCGLVLYLLRRRSPRTLFLLAIVLLAVASSISCFFGWSMQFWGEEGIQQFADESWTPTPEVIQAELDAYRGGWTDQMAHRSLTAFFFETFLFFLGGIGVKTLAITLAGMGLFKLGVFSAARSVRFYVILAAIGFGVGLPLVEFGVRRHFANDWDIRYSFFFGGQYNFWASSLVSLGYVGVIMLVVKLGWLRPVTRVLAAVGRMAFTNYIMQTVICTTIFYGHGFGQFGRLERVEQLGVVVAVWAVQLIWSPIWLHYFRAGPLEWLWRSLSYWQRQPFRRASMPVTHA